MTEILQCADLDARLVRSGRRKSVGIYVRDGQVVVRAPLREPLERITRFVNAKQHWIRAHLQHQQETLARGQHTFVEGDRFYLFHQPLRLTLAAGRPAGVTVAGEHLRVVCPRPTDSRAVKTLLEDWYRQTASQHFAQRVEHFAKTLALEPAAIAIRRYKTRWGSCTRDRKLQFNWLLLMAPKEVIDYVVVHELAHIRHFNHSADFWRLIGSQLPDYAQQRLWLKQQTLLTWPDND